MSNPVLAVTARRDAMHQYAAAHDRFGARHHELCAEGRKIEAAGIAFYTDRLFRAWQAELKPPKDLEQSAPCTQGCDDCPWRLP